MEDVRQRDLQEAPADQLSADPEHTAAKLAADLAKTEFDKWIQESVDLAPQVYTFNAELLGGSPNKTDAGVLPPGYTKAAEAVAKRRGVLAGFRMAAVLKTLVE